MADSAHIHLDWEREGTGSWQDDLGKLISESLADKGWCMIQMPRDEATNTGVLSQVEQLEYEVPKAEFVADLLGKDGRGKICYLNPDSSAAFLSAYDDRISTFCSMIDPWTWQIMGFKTSGRTEGMVWTPYSSRREEQALLPQPLGEDDVENGLVELHLNFIQRRKICCLYFLSTEGGTVSLYSKGEEVPRVGLDVSADQLLVFRCDEMMFHHEPDGEFAIFESWIMEEPPLRDMQAVVADSSQRGKLQGLVNGVGMPSGRRIMIDSTNCSVGGSANSTVQCWSMFTSGTDGMVYVPKSRFDTDQYFAKEGEDFIPGLTSYHKHGGCTDDDRVTCFDHECFKISAEEAPLVWPRQRLVLEVGYPLLISAGFTRASLNGKNIGMYMGDCGATTRGDWTGVIFQNLTPENTTFVNSAQSCCITSNRLHYLMGMRGPTMSFDTACSSGLCAFSVGVGALRNPTQSQFQSFACSSTGIEGAMAGGTMLTGPGGYVGNSAGSMLSHEGRCFTYDTSADGYARGEGCSMVYYRPVSSDAEKDTMMACCIGAVSNQDGRSATLTAPNGPSQTACTKAALREGGITSGEVNASECHGTGTALGDPIEIGALIGVHGADRTNGSAFGLTSTKSNIGHGEDNAGSAGLFKCILMAQYSTCTPNCHLRSMNSNLAHAGFPALFTTEGVDANLNSAISGVSSFGFGGANAHAEIWAQSKVGAHATTQIEMQNYDQLTVTCPITMGQIDYLTGEPAVDFEVAAPVKVKANVLREPLADYGISRHAYDGKFRFRESDADEEGDDDTQAVQLPPQTTVHVCGSWGGWAHIDEMEETDEGIFTITALLGNTRCESFYLCLNGDPDSRLYPAVNNATPMISVLGPSDKGQGKCWLIDGRDHEVPAGVAYKICLRWGQFPKVWWEEFPYDTEGYTMTSTISHIYSVRGSFNSYQLQDLKPDSVEPGVWTCCFKISEGGQEFIQFVRDHDSQQTVYPNKPDATSTDIPLRGPDGWGSGKYWLVHGKVDEIVEVRIEEEDGRIEVQIGLQVWESCAGWSRHDYFLKSFTTLGCNRMTMAEPGIFQYTGAMSNVYSEEHQGYIECFQILVDEDSQYCFYPAVTNSGSGTSITCEPDGCQHGDNWLIVSLWPAVKFEVTFNPTLPDRRKWVTWKLLG